jgi:hypothetical protein
MGRWGDREIGRKGKKFLLPLKKGGGEGFKD